jgi:C-terminal processing protease CtpA/Prc
MDVLTRSGMERKLNVTIGDNIQDPPVSRVIATRRGEKVGYLYLHSFTTAQFVDMDRHFQKFKKAGVNDLVLDLRYNGGGDIDYLTHLGSLIAGQALAGKPFIRLEHGQRYEDRDEDYTFKRLPQSMSARRVIVLTTDHTCSASEAVINGLRPYIPVTTVGSTTCGKPYLMESFEFGDRTLYPITGIILNSRGDADYDKGIRPDYRVKDDTSHQLGNPLEAMLKKALEILGEKI